MIEARNNNQREHIWWLHPVAVFVGLNGLTAIAAFLADPGVYLKMWRTPKYVDGSTVLLTAGVIVAFSAGVWLAAVKQSDASKDDWHGTVSFSQTLLLFNFSFW